MVHNEFLANVPTDLLIDGAWVPADDGERFSVDDPATGTSIASVATATESDAAAAVGAAARAQAGWAATAPRRRADLLHATYNLVLEHTEDLARLITLEMGKPLAESRAEVQYGADYLRWFAEESVRTRGRFGDDPDGAGSILVSRRPVGPSLLITPWNFPLAMLTRKIAPALAAGCTVVVKPSEYTPCTALFLAELLQRAGAPRGVVNVIPTNRSPGAVSAAMRHPGLRNLSFTGSTEVGRILLRQAADGVLRTSMELGGNAPFLVFEDADIPAAVDGAMRAKFRNMGQACTAANRFLVSETVHDAFVAHLAARVEALRIGRGSDPSVDIGPLITRRALQATEARVAEALAEGASAIVGGRRVHGHGNFFEPTLLTGVRPGMRVFDEELFAPVAAVTTFTTEQEAIDLANATPYGLAAYAYTESASRVQRLIGSVATGMLGVNTGMVSNVAAPFNTGMVSNVAAPFGGVGWSGLGREGGSEGIEEYLDTSYAFLAER